MSAVSYIYTSVTNLLRIIKGANIVVGKFPQNLLCSKKCIPEEALTWDIGYYIHIYKIQLTGYETKKITNKNARNLY